MKKILIYLIQEVMETFGGIAQSIKDGNMDKLISYHA